MGRFYTVSFSNVAVTTAVDTFEIIAPSNKAFRLHEINISQNTDFGDSQAEGLSVLIKRGIGNTAGSGGTAATPSKNKSNDAASSCTAKTNNTTQAVAGAGSLTTLRSEAFNVQGGYSYMVPVSQRLYFDRSEVCIVSITLPGDSLTMSGSLVFEELA